MNRLERFLSALKTAEERLETEALVGLFAANADLQRMTHAQWRCSPSTR